MGRLEDKIAIVTGGGQGIGKAIAGKLAAEGATVVVTDLDEASAKETADALPGAIAIRADVTDRQGVQAMVSRVVEQFGHVDVLVNNAGMSPLYERVDTISEELYDKVLDVNLKGPFRLSALVGTRMAGPDHGGSDGGSIIFVSSIASQRPSPVELVYGAAKAGVNNLTYGLARTLGPKVRVNCIVPGPFLTDISKAWDMDRFNRTATTAFALGRGGEPGEIVGAALYLASDASSYTTGTTINVDGGPR
jgi:NAD(P)-dependent dehydrogenase (short-subunit alcohol dehydrogenase family)